MFQYSVTDSDSNSAELRQQLVDRYHELPVLEQWIFQLLSVIYEPVNRGILISCLNQLQVRDQNGQPFTGPTLEPYLNRLLKAELLVQEAPKGLKCHPLLVEIATRDAVKLGRFAQFVGAVNLRMPITKHWKGRYHLFNHNYQLIREVRIGIYRQKLDYIAQQLDDYHRFSYVRDKISLSEIYQQVCNNPFDAEWFRTLPKDLYESILFSLLNTSILYLTPVNEVLSVLQVDCAGEPDADSLIYYVHLVEQLLLRNRLQDAQQILDRISTAYGSQLDLLWGWLYFLQGDDERSLAHYTSALQSLKKGKGKRKVYFHSLGGLFFILLLMKEGSAARLQEAGQYASIAAQANHWLSPTYSVLESLLQVQRGDLLQKDAIAYAASQAGRHSLDTLFRSLCLYWVDIDRAKTRLPDRLKPFIENAEAAGYNWLAMEASDLLSRLKPRIPHGKKAAGWRQTSDARSLVDLSRPQEAWELCLTALEHLNQPPGTAVNPSSRQRLAWFVTYMPSGCSLQPREQSITVKGEWGKGRVIALRRLKDELESLDYLTPQDRQICTHLKITAASYYGSADYHFDERAIADLVGHPLVFWEDAPTTRIEVVKGEPELLVKKGKDDQLTLRLSPELKANKTVLAVKESPTRLKVIEVTSEHRRIAEILGQRNRLSVPSSAKERVLAAINAVSSMVTVHSDIGGDVANAEEVPSEPTPHIHLLPSGEGLKVAVLTRPFAQGGPYYRPGAGGEMVVAEIDGKRLQTTRNLRQEKKLANAAVAACPTLARQDETDGEWWIDDPEDCLEFLMELKDLGDGAIVEWPEGEKLRVTHAATLSNFQMTIKRQNDWFATEGELKLDDQHILDMQQLMDLLARSPGRFIPLGDGQFLALTQEFRKRLDELRAYSEKSGKGRRVHPLAALAMEDWMDEVGALKADKHWKAHIQRLKDIQNFEPTLPSTLQAELRDYQLDGFRWLARLAEWGVGACLADDMGLGKTLQALAVILMRSPDGPTLVVAPTSVGMNWINEAQRFAPTLNVVQFGSGDRQKLLDNLKPFDMLVCSYGLLQQEDVAEMLSKVQWQTIVLDEAQSIKNFATKRSQAAMSLQGGFKLITTGTPIENHLGELWNLFRFINPGLLGSLDHFNQRFAIPIERYGDRQARVQLKKLIQPFLLRRTKSEVLSELPSRTEILLHVDLSQDELAFYEALRREAIAKLSESDAAAGQKHLQVLAEIMRLRRACCNPRLVQPELDLSSSKLQLFGEVLEELLSNRHKALVFSQFVDHLRILREYLDAQKIHYQYLDGSTPAAERKKRVDAFQAGQGDVFLISLKAGGTGLNLTAADYVIHMDPWWNPAVEDQASDRAHRIGQQRPVTIYRLVAKNTIEEKIVNLHQHKRDLADSLLEGADMSGKVSTDELLQLIQAG